LNRCLPPTRTAYLVSSDSYWGPVGVPVGLTLVVIVAGAIWVLRPLGMLPMAVSFLATLATLVGVLAATGQSFFAVWHSGPATGLFYWARVVLSPETLIFVFFMMSDPQTTPTSRTGRVVFGITTALVASGLIAVQPTEYGVKLALLASLTVSSILVPLLDRLGHRREQIDPSAPSQPSRPPSLLSRLRITAARPAVVAAAIITVVAPAYTTALADNEQLLQLEQSGSENGIHKPSQPIPGLPADPGSGQAEPQATPAPLLASVNAVTTVYEP
jgi:hypothetical protein